MFFQRLRLGKDGKMFSIYKSVRMLKDSSNLGTGTVTMTDDPRVLPVGKYLRKLKINEMPQLLNVFLGDMSVVGPRPQAPRCFNAFPEDMQKIIVQVKPGLSGLGPIVFRGEEDILDGSAASLEFYDKVIAPYKGQVEAWYVAHPTLRNYFAVILVTVWVVLFPKSQLVWRAFEGFPVPPDELKTVPNFPG